MHVSAKNEGASMSLFPVDCLAKSALGVAVSEIVLFCVMSLRTNVSLVDRAASFVLHHKYAGQKGLSPPNFGIVMHKDFLQLGARFVRYY